MPTVRENLEAIKALVDETLPLLDAEPVPTPSVSAIVQVTDNNGGEWEKGVSKQVTRILIPSNAETRRAAVVGATGTFADGSKRRVIDVASDARNLYPKFEGPRLDPDKVGHPKTVTFTTDESSETEEPTPEPEPVRPPSAKRKGVMGTALGMGMGYPQLVPGIMGQHWNLPTEDDIIRAKSYGLELFRLGSLRERLIKPGGKHELYLGEKDALPNIVKWLRLVKKHGCQAMLDLFHNYGGFSEGNNAIKSGNPQHKKIGTPGGPTYDTFAYDWKAIIEYLQTDADAWDAVYGIDNMNEWVGLPSDNVFRAHQRFLDVCAPIMGDKLAILEGNAYSNTPNFWDHNAQFKDLKDPRGPGFIEMSGHLYADQDMSGSYKTGDTVRKGESFDTFYINKLKPFLDGCDKYGYFASVGEWIVPGDHPRLLEGSRKGIEYGLDRGCNFIVFGMGKGYSTNASNHWNLEIPRNKPTLEVVKNLAAR